jgi:predicted membrane-bound spermidine synthase
MEDNLKVRAALFAFTVLTSIAGVIALMILAKTYQGTEELKYAVVAAGTAFFAWILYSERLDTLEREKFILDEVIRKIKK